MLLQPNRPQLPFASQSDLVVELLQKENKQLKKQVPERNETIKQLASKIDAFFERLTEVLVVQRQGSMPYQSPVAA